MDKMSLLSILLVSLPEEILFVVTTLTVAGYKDVLNLKEKKNFIKLMLASILMVLISASCRLLLPLSTFSSYAMLVLFPMVIILVYKQRFLPSILGFLLSITVLVICEAALLSPFLKLLKITLQDVHSSDMTRILASIPVRALQLLVAVIICRIKDISLSTVKLTIEEWIRIALFGIIILSSMVFIESGLRNLQHDSKTMLHFIINICVAVLFCSWMFCSIFKLRKRRQIDEKIRNFELQRIRKLLAEGHTKLVIELIDTTLNNKGVSL